MVKESDTEHSKKRRKSVETTAMKDGDVYKTIITYEEKEAVERYSEKDSETFLNICDEIRKSMTKIAELKTSNDAKAKEEISELQIKTSLAFIELKKLNRMEKFRTKFARDSLASAKSNVDSRHLHLQNLLYEVMHLKKEVMKCLQFKSKDEMIELVSEEEFYREAPETISRPEITKKDEHQLKLARLEWELTQRKQLSSLCDELSDSKKGVASSIEQKQARLDNLAPQLRTILDSSKPLQESLGLPLDKIRQEHKMAALLSSPLYVLYAKTSAYRDAYDSSLTVTIEGDEDEAQRTNNQERPQESDSDAENAGENVIEEAPVHKKRHHRMSKEARLEDKKSKLLQRHPLSVKLIINFSKDTKLTLQFYYLTILKVITVESNLENVDIGGVSAGDMLISESILRELYSKDTGLESPNPANHYQLERHRLGAFHSLGLGYPYKWAQRMAGIYFDAPDVQEQRANVTSQQLAHDNIENVLREVKRRVKARLALCTEIQQLESGNLQIIPETTDPMPTKINTYLHKFVTMSWRSYCNNPETPLFCREGLVNSVDFFYEAVFRRDSNELVARIAIKPDYPKVTPVFSISMNSMNLTSADVIRDMEREINVMWEKPPTLTAQIQRLRACFDIFLETEGRVTREKIFFYSVKGRTRARPYKYVPLGGGIFTHR
ncbi:THO complex subunit 5 homolog [Leptopilina heterotoma]|uniref:THO complex subunit 5 homolog n=1 Tax=Leptopilina heterotoma TaxID=63436 RepID=UPI001CA7C4C8|nr:THO complex subunit 5 homolog [Leptopilina heterotoma]